MTKTTRLLSNIEGILLDMNSTFMFDEDNFDEQQDYYSTYLKIGGKALSKKSVNNIIQDCFNGMAGLYEDPAYFENFPSLREAMNFFSEEAKNLNDDEISLLTDVFALHESGKIPEEYAGFLHLLSGKFALGLVTNIWSPRHYWIEEFRSKEIDKLFEVMVFSSDDSFIKPSLKIYQEALSEFSVKDVDKIAFIGDSLTYDMQGAKEAGLQTIWINHEAYEKGSKIECVDFVIPDLLCLEEVFEII